MLDKTSPVRMGPPSMHPHRPPPYHGGINGPCVRLGKALVQGGGGEGEGGTARLSWQRNHGDRSYRTGNVTMAKGLTRQPVFPGSVTMATGLTTQPVCPGNVTMATGLTTQPVCPGNVTMVTGLTAQSVCPGNVTLATGLTTQAT